MRLGKHAAMVGLATATISFAILSSHGCSSPPTQTGTAGSSGQGQSGTSGQGQSGTSGQGQSGTSGQGQSGTSGQGTAGDGSMAGSGSGTAGSTAGSSGSGTAGAAGGGTAGGTAGGAGGMGGSMGTAGTGTGGATACPQGVIGHCNADTGDPKKYPGFTLLLDEEFDTAVDLDTDPTWTWSDGGPPEGQTRFNESQITFTGGQMIITAIKQNVPASLSYAEPAQGQNTGTASQRNVLSGEFRTKYNNYRYGRYEAKYQAPMECGACAMGDGNFLSTMFTFRTPKWLKWRELDNELEANIKTKVAWNVVNADNAPNYPGGDSGNGAPMVTPFNIQQMHTYMIEWLPTKVTWYVDGQMLRSNNNTAPGIPTLSAKIMMNLWVFAGAGLQAFGNTSNNVYPFHATYEYFRYYKWDMETDYPKDPKTLSTADTNYSQNNPKETTYP